jgi:DNA-binding LacI/PurR family transcriptional regulator
MKRFTAASAESTIRDLARRAGVSITTTSYALDEGA